MRGYKIKDTITILLIIALGLFISMLFSSCQKESIYAPLCDGNCDTYYTIIYENQEIIPNNGYYEIPWNGLNYFQVRGQLTKLHSDYCNIEGTPFIEAKFDTDYWVVFDNIFFQTPMYSYLGWFSTSTLNNPIPIGNITYTLEDLISLHPPYNIAGYQIPKNFCTECPYAPTIVGTYSKYNYNPTQNFFLDDEMVGDTINVFIETTFNTEGGLLYNGRTEETPQETITDKIKVIII